MSCASPAEGIGGGSSKACSSLCAVLSTHLATTNLLSVTSGLLVYLDLL